MIVLLVMVQLSSWFANGQHARATINDFVAKATKKIDKTLVKKKLEENAKKAQKPEYRRRTYAEQKAAAAEKKARGKAKMKRKPIRSATRVT